MVWRINQHMISSSNLLETLFQERWYLADIVLENWLVNLNSQLPSTSIHGNTRGYTPLAKKILERRAHHVREQAWRYGSPVWMITRGKRDQTMCYKNRRRQLKTFISVTITHNQIQRTPLSTLIQFIVRQLKPSQEYTATNHGINSGVSSKNRIKELQIR